MTAERNHCRTRILPTLPLLLGALAISALSGCGDSDPPTGPQTGTVEVTLQSDAFAPAQVTIEAGTTVRWINGGAVQHTVTPDGHDEWSRAVLDSDGQVFEHTFDEPGEFPYLCEPHQALGMVGTIRVEP